MMEIGEPWNIEASTQYAEAVELNNTSQSKSRLWFSMQMIPTMLILH